MNEHFIKGAYMYFKQAGYEDDVALALVDAMQKVAITAAKGLSAKQRSNIARKARKGEDIGKKGKNFKKVERNAARSGASDPAAVAAAAMWKARAKAGK